MMRTLFTITFLVGTFSILLYGQSANVQKLIQEGVELHDAGEYKSAIGKYRKALEIDPKDIHATYELSLSYLALNDYQNASKFSTVVINSKNKELSTGAYAVKSEALAGMNRLEDAINLLEEGLIKNGDEYLLHFNLAVNHYIKGDIENAIGHIKKSIDLDKSHSDAFLLNAYALNDKGLWVQSILSFQMFLLLEPDSKRSKNAFEEMLRTMRIKITEEPLERSFIQQQLIRKTTKSSSHGEIPPLSIEEGLNRNFVYHAIITALDSLKNTPEEESEFTLFKTVNKEIMQVIDKESKRDNNSSKEGVLWTFYIPFFSHIFQSDYYDTFCRYISVSYYHDSYEWWQQNTDIAQNFITWFEKGDNI